MWGKATYNYTSFDLGTPALYIRAREKNHEKKFQNPTRGVRLAGLSYPSHPLQGIDIFIFAYVYPPLHKSEEKTLRQNVAQARNSLIVNQLAFNLT